MAEWSFWEKTKRSLKREYYKFGDWFTEKEHPHSRFRKHDFFMNLVWFVGLCLIFSILYSNSESLNEIVIIIVRLGSVLQLVTLYFIVKRAIPLWKNLKYGFRGLNNGTKTILAILVLVALIFLFLNQQSAVLNIKQAYNQTDFTTFNPFDSGGELINGTLVGADLDTTRFTNFLPQPWGFLVFWAIIIGIVLFLLSTFVFGGEIPGWLWWVLIIVGVLLLFNLHLPYNTVELNSYNLYCNEDNQVMMKNNFLGLGSWETAWSCLEYKSSRCRPLCVDGEPSCQCEAVPIDILFRTEGDWIFGGW